VRSGARNAAVDFARRFSFNVYRSSITARSQLARARKAPAGRTVPVRLSMTTYPARVGAACQTLETIIYGQRVRPEAVTLVLAEDEFAGTSNLPLRLRRLEDHGLEVLWVPRSTRSYMKLLPALERYPAETIVTADDDILYPAWWLELLVEAHTRHPGTIVGHRGWEVRIRGARNLVPYTHWARATTRTASARTFLTGVGGVLYPPGCLPMEAHETALIERLSPNADDVWFHAMALLRGTPVRVTLDPPVDFPSTWRTGNPAGLQATNVRGGQNDLALNAVYDYWELWDVV